MGKPSRTTNAATEGAPLALDAIMAEHQAAIRRYVERQGFRGADGDDMVQEIFHGAARSLPRFDPGLGSMRAWLLRIAFNLISKERKRAHRRHEELWPEEALDGLSSEAPDSETRLIAAQRSEVLAGLLQEVPPRRRDILVAHDLEEETVEDIAAEHAMPRNTVWNDLRLARLSLKAAERRWRARNRGRGVLLAPLAVVFGAIEARASSAPLRGRPLRRLLDWARRGLRRGRSQGEPGLTARSWRTARAARMAAGRWMASTAAAIVAGALFLFSPGGRGDSPQSQAHAVALRSPPAAWAVQRGSALASAVEVPSAEMAAGSKSSVLRTASQGQLRARPRHPPGRAPDDDTRATGERRLMRRAITTLAAGRGDAARLLLERHRRDFPQGTYAGDREEILRRLQAEARRD